MAVKRTRSEIVEACKQRQLEKGWRRVQVMLPPEAADALALLLARNEGSTAVGIIGELLIAKARKLPTLRTM